MNCIALVVDISVKQMLISILPCKGLNVFVLLLWGVAPEHMFLYSDAFPGCDPNDCFVLVLQLGAALVYM